MKKNELMVLLNDILNPFGFKKKGNCWVINGNEITKIVNLQKSQFSNMFYINYGYIINTIPLDNLTMHIFKGFGSIDNIENRLIKELLNLENDMSDEYRAKELKEMVLKNLVSNVTEINTENDLLNELTKQPNLNNVPGVVKKHFNLL